MATSEPRGYRVHTNTWTKHGPQLDADEVLGVLDRVDAHFDPAVQSYPPQGHQPTDQTKEE